MVLNQIKIEDILERYSVLPDELLTVLEDPNTEKIVEVVCQKNNISKPEWIDIIKQLVGYVLMGFIHYYDLGAEINTELNFPNSKLGNDVASEIDAKIFSPIKNLLEKNYSPVQIKQDVLEQSFEEIIQKTENKEEKIKEEIEEPQTIIKEKEQTIESKVQPPTPVILEKTTITAFSPSQKDIKKQPLTFVPFVPIPEKIIPSPQTENELNQKKIPQISNVPLNISPSTPKTENTKFESKNIPNPSILEPISIPKPKTISEIYPKQNNQNQTQTSQIPTPPPVFIHKEETISSIKKGVEIKPPEIKISNVKSMPTPPKPVQIEIGSQNKTENKDLGIKVVNYSESAINQPETPNISKKEEPQNNLKIPPLSSQSPQTQKPLPPTPPPPPNSFSQIPPKPISPKIQEVSNIPPLPPKPNIPPPLPKP